MLDEKDMININKDGWNKVADQLFEGSFSILDYGSYAPSERELNLQGDIKNKVILEVVL